MKRYEVWETWRVGGLLMSRHRTAWGARRDARRWNRWTAGMYHGAPFVFVARDGRTGKDLADA